MKKKQIDKALLQLVRFLVVVVAVTFGIQFVFEKAIHADALTYILPVALASYFIGKAEGQKEANEFDRRDPKKPV